MKRVLALAASLLLMACLFGLSAAADPPEDAPAPGYKVYPNRLTTNTGSSAILKMTPGRRLYPVHEPGPGQGRR